MKIIVGLGNPGEEYSKTRHNIGWLYLEHLEAKYKFNISKKENDSLIGESNIAGKKVIFVKPQTYMNLSGNAVQKIKHWYKVENEDILVVFDDIDIPFGDVRYRTKGSGGTHNGMKNIVQMLATEQIARIKLGIGGIKHPKQELRDFVLQRFSQDEIGKFKEIFHVADQKLLDFIDK
ncbi:MAG: aminoacyl-tRNA hydrolase [Clostridia bacterium]|nr:aminoacyl-tRNA hydrolase [Clostridia bacterium]